MTTTQQERQTTPRVVFLVPDSLLAVIDAQAAAADRTRTAEMLRALKSYYRDQGHWPPGRKDEAD